VSVREVQKFPLLLLQLFHLSDRLSFFKTFIIHDEKSFQKKKKGRFSSHQRRRHCWCRTPAAGETFLTFEFLA
jgi:hypothetical protein